MPLALYLYYLEECQNIPSTHITKSLTLVNFKLKNIKLVMILLCK